MALSMAQLILLIDGNSPKNVFNGGTAVKGSILIENYGLVSGGGGGGGGTGVICYNIAAPGLVMTAFLKT